MSKEPLEFRTLLEAVLEFHRAYGIQEQYVNPNVAFAKRDGLVRYKLMREENEEYLDAHQAMDMVEIADAIGDMLYILCGTIITHGLQDHIEEIFMEIHRSNMTKLGEDGKPVRREDGKVLKGPHYQAPNLKRFFELYGLEKKGQEIQKVSEEGTEPSSHEK
jgi:predicted HAD superfamily Cof-like phosphohydrolase